MRVLSNSEVLKQFSERNPIFDGPNYTQADERGLFFTHPESSCIALKYPEPLERLPFFVRHLSTLGYEPWHFNGALLWFTEYGVWNCADEGIGYRIIEQMNRAAGQPSSFEASLGHDFRGDELNETVGMLLQPIIFSWDAWYLPYWSWGTGEFFIHISHDSHILVVTKTKAFYDKVFAELQQMNYDPEPFPDEWKGRFCRSAAFDPPKL
jgi:hypothetical protein